MSSFTSKNALVLIDFINEIVDEKGKLAGKGYFKFNEQHNSLNVASQLLDYARKNNFAIIHVGLGFSTDYKEQPENSPLFGGAKKFNALQIGTWGTRFHEKVSPIENEMQITKHRVSAFFGTPLDIVLKCFGVENLYIAGCATDMAVQSTIRDAHDRDFNCHIVSDACIAASDEDHNQTIKLLSKVSKIISFTDLK